MEAKIQSQIFSHPLAGPKIHYRPSQMDPNVRFYRHFVDTATALQEQIEQLESIAVIGGERQEAIDHVLAGISKLQNEVADAAEFTPAYDRKQYSAHVKGLQDKVNETVTRITPKSRFQFRKTKTAHVDMGASENDPRLKPGSISLNNNQPFQGIGIGKTAPSRSSNHVVEQEDAVSELPPSKDYNKEMATPSDSSIRKPSFSTSKSIGISNQSSLHIILPATAAKATAAGSLTDLKGCIVDMSVPTTNKGASIAGLMMKNITHSLIVAGRVNGPVHITGVKNSVIVVSARQARIHECENVDVYLHCGSHPIIEDCQGMRFAPLPEPYTTDAERNKDNQWDQVDDFKWLKAGDSPNWTALSEESRLTDEIWLKVVPGQPGSSVVETLAKCGISRE